MKEELKKSEKRIEELEQGNIETEVEGSIVSDPEPNLELVTEQMNEMNQRVLRLNGVVEKLIAENEYLKKELREYNDEL